MNSKDNLNSDIKQTKLINIGDNKLEKLSIPINMNMILSNKDDYLSNNTNKILHTTTNNNTNTSHNQQKSMSYYTTHSQQTHINLHGMKEKQYIQSTECLSFIYNKDIEVYHNFVKNIDLHDGSHLLNIHQISNYISLLQNKEIENNSSMPLSSILNNSNKEIPYLKFNESLKNISESISSKRMQTCNNNSQNQSNKNIAIKKEVPKKPNSIYNSLVLNEKEKLKHNEVSYFSKKIQQVFKTQAIKPIKSKKSINNNVFKQQNSSIDNVSQSKKSNPVNIKSNLSSSLFKDKNISISNILNNKNSLNSKSRTQNNKDINPDSFNSQQLKTYHA